jgi:Family of unknown function (DUF6496)
VKSRKQAIAIGLSKAKKRSSLGIKALNQPSISTSQAT